MTNTNTPQAQKSLISGLYDRVKSADIPNANIISYSRITDRANSIVFNIQYLYENTKDFRMYSGTVTVEQTIDGAIKITPSSNLIDTRKYHSIDDAFKRIEKLSKMFRWVAEFNWQA